MDYDTARGIARGKEIYLGTGGSIEQVLGGAIEAAKPEVLKTVSWCLYHKRTDAHGWPLCDVIIADVMRHEA